VSEFASQARREAEASSLELTRSVHLAVRQRGLRGRRLRVVLLVHNMGVWDSLAELWHLMDRADDIDPVVVSLPMHFGGDGDLADEEDTHAALTARGVPHLRSEVGYDPLALLRILAPDVVFRQSQWDRDVDPRLSTANLAFTRLCLVPYEMLNVIKNSPCPGRRTRRWTWRSTTRHGSCSGPPPRWPRPRRRGKLWPSGARLTCTLSDPRQTRTPCR